MFCLNNNQRPINAHDGVTITETIVAVAVSSVLFLFVMMVYSSFVNVSGVEKKQTTIQNEFINAFHFLEKDIFRCGFNVPGNGVYATISSIGNDIIDLLYSENETTTTLNASALPGDSVLVVNDYKGVLSNQWVCLKQNSDVSYYQIKKICLGNNTAPDTLMLKSKTGSVAWDQTKTKAYFAKSVRWSIEPVSGQNFLERENLTSNFGFSTIDSIKITVQDASGNPISAPYTHGKSLGVKLVGHDGPMVKNSFCTKSFCVKLRNCL